MAVPPEMLSYLARKYDILEQDSKTAATTANANANFTTVKANLLPAEVASEAALRQSQAGLAAVQATQLPIETSSINRYRQQQSRTLGLDALNTDFGISASQRPLSYASLRFADSLWDQRRRMDSTGGASGGY